MYIYIYIYINYVYHYRKKRNACANEQQIKLTSLAFWGINRSSRNSTKKSTIAQMYNAAYC